MEGGTYLLDSSDSALEFTEIVGNIATNQYPTILLKNVKMHNHGSKLDTNTILIIVIGLAKLSNTL